MLKLLDLFCCAGGAAKGYADAGFEIVGIDNEEQRYYPYTFRKADFRDIEADWIAENFDAVHASPPCQAFSSLAALHPEIEHPDFVAETRQLLKDSGLPYVIENVVGAPLIDPTILCGSSFGLRVQRHRLFETNFPCVAPPCDHGWQKENPIYYKARYHDGVPNRFWAGSLGVYGGGEALGEGEAEKWKDAMEIDWMPKKKLAQAIPPAFTKYIGDRLRRHIMDQERIEDARKFKESL